MGSILNFSLMYFLAPTAGASAACANLLQKLFSEQTLRAWGAPGMICSHIMCLHIKPRRSWKRLMTSSLRV